MPTTLYDIADEIASMQGMPKDVVRAVAQAVFDRIIAHAKANDPVNIRRVGTFRTIKQKARRLRNPQTGARIKVGEKWKMRWASSPKLTKRLNAKEPGS